MADYSYERLKQSDNTFLVLENRNAHMHVGATQIFDAGTLLSPGGGVDVDRIRRYVESRLHLIPRYRQRLEWTPLENHPVWIDDERFNIFYHVRHTRLPPPGDERTLKRTVARLMSQQLDLHKPLWELWVIEGLEGNRVAVVNKTHHCVVDGISGADLISTLLTLEPTEEIEPPRKWIPRPAPSRGELLRDEALRRLGMPIELARNVWRVVRDEGNVRHDLSERLRAAGQMLQAGLRNASNTPFNQAIGPYWRLDWMPMPFEAIREIKRALGGTVNDVVLATVAGAVRHFLQESRHVNVDDLDFRVMAPVSLRTASERGQLGNRVSAWTVPLPVSEPDPQRRLEQIRATTSAFKDSKLALGAETLTEVSEWLGTGLLSFGARVAQWGRPFNMVVTNVPGPPVPLYLLGAEMREAYPMVPLFGNLASGIALFSYAGTIYWGVTADWDLIPDLHDFLLAIQKSFAELREAASRVATVPLAAPAKRKAKPDRRQDRSRVGKRARARSRRLVENAG
jgi:WS/DGAT/MGAT family acyltransferase